MLTYYFCNFFDEKLHENEKNLDPERAHFPGSANVYLLYLQKSQKIAIYICQNGYREKLEYIEKKN